MIELTMNKVTNEKVIITRLSSASWFKIQSSNRIIHVDPGYTGYFSNQGIPSKELEEKADLILISHFHKDHLQPEAVSKIIKKETVILAPESCKGRLKDKWHEVKPGDSVNYFDIRIDAIDAYNTEYGHSTRKVHHKGDYVGYILNISGKRIYFAGDTDLIPEMNTLGNIELAFLPIGGTFVMDIGEAIEAARVIKPRVVIPMHQSRSDINIFKKQLNAEVDSQAVVLEVGGVIEV